MSNNETVVGLLEFKEPLINLEEKFLVLMVALIFMEKNPATLRKEFKNSLKIFLEVCEEKSISTRKEFSGKFNLRIPPRLHSKIAAIAAGEDKSINEWVSENLEKSTENNLAYKALHPNQHMLASGVTALFLFITFVYDFKSRHLQTGEAI